MIEGMKIKTECGVCSTPVLEYSQNKEELVKTPEYHEVEVRNNDKTRMRVAVCSQHLEPTEDDLKVMDKKVHQGWLEEVALGIGNASWVINHSKKIKITGMAT